MSRQVIVLGVHRSGTSCMAGVLHHLGIPTGYRLLPADRNNRAGHYEDMDFLFLNNYLIGNWMQPETRFRKGADLLYEPLIRHRDQDFPVWAAKDPRFCITLPLFIGKLSDPRFIVCDRPIGECVNSLNRAYFEGRKQAQAEAIQARYAQRLERVIERFDRLPWLRIGFADLLADPFRTVERVQDFIFGDLERPGEDRVRSAIGHVFPGLARHSSAETGPAGPPQDGDPEP